MPDELRNDGSFGTGGLPPLVRELVRRLVVGRLDVDNRGGVRRFWFDAGQVRAVSSELEDEKLGNWLAKRGVLDPNRMAILLLRQPDGIRFGSYLVQEGVLTPEALTKELETLSVAIVSNMLLLPGSYAFSEGEKLPIDAVSLEMTTASLLAAAVRAVRDAGRLEVLTAGEGYVWTSQDALFMFQKVQLTPPEGYLLSRVDGTSTVAGLRRLVPIPGGEFTRALAALAVTGLVEIHAASATAPLAPTKMEQPPEEPAADADQAVQYTPQQQREYAEVIKLAGEIRHRDYYRRLGLSPGATQDQIHSRYLEFVKSYHPDRAREPHLLSLRSELAEIYSGLQEAYQILGHPESRARYEQTLASSQGTSQGVDAYHEEERRRKARAALVDANLRRALELLRAGDVGMAVQLLDQAARLSPTAETLLMLARAEFKNPMWTQRALDHLKHAVAVEPDFTEAWLELANFWATRNRIDNQQQCLQKILEYDPGNADVKASLASLKRGKLLRKHR